ncbi:LOW QUALITY PROTEIN: splicing factor 3B subunit 2 [Columba livia]|uniref:LOW QUALITY PROTEIN: splicing factor 3B subunit 2 n=1 Tax=Columba livia TaxID=8932 RepID=UPI0031BA04A9
MQINEAKKEGGAQRRLTVADWPFERRSPRLSAWKAGVDWLLALHSLIGRSGYNPRLPAEELRALIGSSLVVPVADWSAGSRAAAAARWRSERRRRPERGRGTGPVTGPGGPGELSPYSGWAPAELQATLAGIGAPAQGSREELLERLQNYTLQTRIVLSRPVLRPEDGDKGTGGAPFGDKSKEQELLEQQKRAAVLLEQERQQELAKLAPPLARPPPEGAPMGARAALPPRGESPPPPPMPFVTPLVTFVCNCSLLSPPTGSTPMGAPPPMGAPRPRGPPPPPGEENREVGAPGCGPRIPQALEKILQLKESRQEELVSGPPAPADDEMETEPRVTESEDETGGAKKERTRKRRNRKKKKKPQRGRGRPSPPPHPNPHPGGPRPPPGVEYITEEPQIFDPNFVFFKRIFEAFKLTDEVKKDKEKEPDKGDRPESATVPKKKGQDEGQRGSGEESDEDEQEKKPEVPKLSKKKLRRMNRFTVAELKQLVARPDVVEMHDVTAQDPKLLVHLKATRNSVPVPRHWCFKRKYLQGKRGIEKPPFELPDFIKRTGIQEMREALQEKEEQKTLKSKMREKVRPKLGKIDIDYQKLHDAFFKWQSKPRLTIHGDLYYEGKEFETRLKEKKPGDLSDELRIALGMPVGPNAHKVPPPWLIAMQRYGPPPSYPNLKIPGLNSPIPEGCSFGYHAGGWGKPPVDETGKPLYGDVFGTNAAEFQTKEEEEEIDRTPWGELEPSDEESSEEEEEEESDEEKPDETGFITPADSGLITPGGFSSVPAGMETPELIELRKKKIEEAMDGSETPQLFTVVPEKRTATVGGAMMGSTHIYDMSAVLGRKGPVPEAQGVEVALAPEELELDPSAMTQKYEEHVREQQAQVEKEDFSDMVAEHAAKQKQKKRKAQPQDARGGGKKYKEFKF